MPPKVSKKRPAGSCNRGPKRPSCQPVEYDGSDGEPVIESAMCASGPELTTAPDWATALVKALHKAELLKASGTSKSLTLRVWSDCTGLATEMFASRELSRALAAELGIELNWVLFCACEKDKRARDFIMANHAPLHCSDDMLHRSFTEGQFWCEMCKANHDLPKQGIDVYIAGYPCSPWSRKGTRTDFDHPDIKPFLIGMKMVNYIKPEGGSWRPLRVLTTIGKVLRHQHWTRLFNT